MIYMIVNIFKSSCVNTISPRKCQKIWPPQSPDLHSGGMTWDKLDHSMKTNKWTSAQRLTKAISENCLIQLTGENAIAQSCDQSKKVITKCKHIQVV